MDQVDGFGFSDDCGDSGSLILLGTALAVGVGLLALLGIVHLIELLAYG